MRKYYGNLRTFYRTEVGTLNVTLLNYADDASEIYHRVWHERASTKEYLGEFCTSLSDMVTQIRAHTPNGAKDLGCCVGLEAAVSTLADNFGIGILDF